MLNKTNTKKKILQSYTKRVSNIILFLIITVPIVFCAFTIIVPELTTYATPTSGGSSTISLSVTDPVVNFHFTSSENSSSAFKQATTSISYSSGNQTGISIYASSIDENTSLKHFQSSVSEEIASISLPQSGVISSPKTWGYRTYNGPAGSWNAIPKASTPALITNSSSAGSGNVSIDFGIKSSPDLPPGTYSKKLIFTAIANRVPTTAVFLPGPQFYQIFKNPSYLFNQVEYFKKADSLPASTPWWSASIPTSERQIYVWLSNDSKTIYWWSDADIVYMNEDASEMFRDINGGAKKMKEIDISGINTSRVKNMSKMFQADYNIYEKIILGDIDTSNVENMSGMFASYGNYSIGQEVETLNLSRFNTSKVKNMSGMFMGTHSPVIDLTHFDTSNVEDMSHMFRNNHTLKRVNLAGLNVKKVRNVTNMFTSSSISETALKEINMSGWQLDQVTDLGGLFESLVKLESINLSNFSAKNALSMRNTFFNSTSLKELDLSTFTIEKVKNMEGTFRNLDSLERINLSGFNTSSVTSMFQMFMNDRTANLVNLDLSSFDTSNVTDMSSMFWGQIKLQNLNLSSFNTQRVQTMQNMFYKAMQSPVNGVLDISTFSTEQLNNCEGMFDYSKVRTIYVSNRFIITPYPVKNLFAETTNLVGGNGTTWTSQITFPYIHYSSRYAHIDAPGNPGYFTQKP
jgi:hypothetical protein rflaF_14162